MYVYYCRTYEKAVYRVPRVSPGVTASKLFSPLLPSLATPGALLFLTDHSRKPGTQCIQSGVQHLLAAWSRPGLRT